MNQQKKFLGQQGVIKPNVIAILSLVFIGIIAAVILSVTGNEVEEKDSVLRKDEWTGTIKITTIQEIDRFTFNRTVTQIENGTFSFILPQKTSTRYSHSEFATREFKGSGMALSTYTVTGECSGEGSIPFDFDVTGYIDSRTNEIVLEFFEDHTARGRTISSSVTRNCFNKRVGVDTYEDVFFNSYVQ